MDGENNGKPYEQMDDLGGFPTIFGNTHVSCASEDLSESKKGVAGFCFAAANKRFDEKRNLGPVFDGCCSSGLISGRENVLILNIYGVFTYIWVA